MSRSTNSLAGRLLLASMILLPLFLGAAGLFLERSHRLSIAAAEQTRLQLQLLTLLAEAEYQHELSMPEQLLEARFNQPESGLYGFITDAGGSVLWRSRSTIAFEAARPALQLPALAVGASHFDRHDGLFQLSYRVLWVTDTGAEVALLFTVLETVAPAEAELRTYRRNLFFGLGGAALLLVICQGFILLWGLRPLQSLARDIDEIERGQRSELGAGYPREIQALTRSLNTLLHSEQQRRKRVRDTFADLAHSLKTPLAVIRSADSGAADFGELVRAQTGQMERIVEYQLQRAVNASHRLLQVVAVAPVLQRLRESLLKVYADKPLGIELAVEPDCEFQGDERDLMELLGNLMDNACKFGRHNVQVSAHSPARGTLHIQVADDGEGIPHAAREAILQRGERMDSRVPGHGIGLAVVADIVANYQGTITITDSSLGGALVTIRLG